MRAPSPVSSPSRARRLTGASLALALVAGGGAMAAAPATAAEPAAAGPSMNVALVGEIDSLNPFVGILAIGTTIHRAQYESLVAWGPEDAAEYPGIAASWEPSDDGAVWTYELEDGALWSDGEQITAEDVVWTYNSIMEDDSLKTAFGGYVSDIESVEALDDLTVEITLSEPQPTNPGTDVLIVPEHVWSQLDDPAAHANNADVVGSGPFVVESASPTSGVVMRANPNHRHGEAAVSQLNWVTYRNTDAAVQALRAGEIDLLSGLTVAQYEALEGVPEITTNAADGRGFRGLQINPGATDIDGQPMGDGHPALRDLAFRQAIVHAIDRETLTERVLEGYATVGTGIIPPMYPNLHVEAATEGLLEFDVEGADRMLEEAGYALNADGARLDLQGNPIQLRLQSYDHASAQQTLDFLGGWLNDLGIATETSITASAEYNDDTVMGTFDMYVSGWSVRPNPDNLFAMNTCGSLPNADGSGATSLALYCGEEFDALYQEASEAIDPAERAELIKEMQLALDQAAVFPVFFFPDVFEAYRNDRFEDFQQQPTGTGPILGQFGGAWGLHSATPAGTEGSDSIDRAAGDSTDASVSPWVWAAIVLAAMLIIAAIILLARRRSAAAADRE